MLARQEESVTAKTVRAALIMLPIMICVMMKMTQRNLMYALGASVQVAVLVLPAGPIDRARRKEAATALPVYVNLRMSMIISHAMITMMTQRILMYALGASALVVVLVLSARPMSQCQTGAVCDSLNGGCVFTNAPDAGTMCDDGDADATDPDVCYEGVCAGRCAGVSCIPDPTDCQEGGICNSVRRYVQL